MSACEKGQKWDKAIAVFESMGASHGFSGFRPGVVAYSAGITALARGHKWQHACGKLAEMAMNRLQPNVTTYSALVTALELGQQWQKALLAFEAMSSFLEPDETSLNASIKAAAKGFQWRAILQFIQHFDERAMQPDARTFVSSIAGLARGGQWQSALQCLERCLQEADTGRLELGVPVNAALFELSKQWLWQRVIQLLSSIEMKGAQHRVSAEVRSAISKGGHVVDKRRWQPRIDTTARRFNAILDELQSGSMRLRLEYDNAMIAFESSPEGGHAIRGALSRHGLASHPHKDCCRNMGEIFRDWTMMARIHFEWNLHFFHFLHFGGKEDTGQLLLKSIYRLSS